MNALQKKAHVENVQLRTNWIKTIEKLVTTFDLLETKNGKMKSTSKKNIEKYFLRHWKQNLGESSRLAVYREIHEDFSQPKYLDLPFIPRRIISRIRCYSHNLEIERGRHKDLPREERVCKICQNGSVEDELHFLIECETYDYLRDLYQMYETDLRNFLKAEDQSKLAKYLLSAFELRGRFINGRVRE